jgi:hypothetical protein
MHAVTCDMAVVILAALEGLGWWRTWCLLGRMENSVTVAFVYFVTATFVGLPLWVWVLMQALPAFVICAAAAVGCSSRQ